MKIYKNFSKSKIYASSSNPSQGIFWWINNKIIPFTEEVNYLDFDSFENFGNYTHKSLWNKISDLYFVNETAVPYDYFPRGRVIIAPTMDDDYHFLGYECSVYGDSCIINNRIFRTQLERIFNLEIPTCTVYYEGDYASDNTHYTCFQCRKK